MRKTSLKREAFAVLLVALLAVLFTACGEPAASSGMPDGTPAPSASVNTGAASSKAPESKSASSKSPTSQGEDASSRPESPLPAQSGGQESQASSTGEPPSIFLLPEIKTGDGEFDRLFAENSIDEQFQFHYLLCSSTDMMAEVCGEAADKWKNMIDTAYRAAMALADDAGRQQLKAEQDRWALELDDRLSAIENGPGDEIDKPLETLQLYRQRAAELCKAKYELDGELPAFEGAVSSAAPNDGPVG